MKKFGVVLIVVLLMCATSSFLEAQERCGADILLEERLQELGTTKEQYAKQLNKATKNITKRLKEDKRTLTDKVYKVPVVVHAMQLSPHPNYPNYHISDEAVYEQIRLLNDHFKEMHENTNDIPEKYNEVRARDTGIEFHLARRDPLGFPTTGITRTVLLNTLENLYPSVYDKWRDIRPLWNTSEYLNIYVVPPSTLPNNLLGIATFPSVDLPGLLVGGTHPQNQFLNDPEDGLFGSFDGVIVSTIAFATKSTNDFVREGLDKGVTTTHEVGHYFGLFHTFGDRDCNPGDYCDDTPAHSLPSTGCVSNTSCAEESMIQNYMDYSGDNCQTMFTLCQRLRMRATLEYALLRFDLSKGSKLEEIEERENDLGIVRLANSTWNACLEQFVGNIIVGNYGTNAISSAEIAVYLNDNEEQRISIIPRPVPSYDTISVPFGPVTVSGTFDQKLSVRVLNVNSTDDSYELNSKDSLIVYNPPTFTELSDIDHEFGAVESNQSVVKVVPTSDGQDEMLAFEMLSSSDETFGQEYVAFSPRLDLSNISRTQRHDATLSFRYSHRGTYNKTATQLRVVVFRGCKGSANTIYYNAGLDLNTAPFRRLNDKPQFDHEWRTIRAPIIDRTTRARLAIQVFNGHSGNLYIDSIRITSSLALERYEANLELLELLVPEISCEVSEDGNPFVLSLFSFTNISLKQRGTPIEEISFDLILNEDTTEIESTNEDLEIYGGEPRSARRVVWGVLGAHLPSDMGLSPKMELKLNFFSDPTPKNNSKTVNFVLAPTDSTFPPIVDEGDLDTEGLWEIITDNDGSTSWQRVQASTGDNDFLRAPFYNQAKDSLTKLISPSIDLSKTQEASISFDVSYAQNGAKSDRLQLFLFEDCIPVPRAVLYDKSGSDLAVQNSTTEWVPSTSSDWRKETIDISEYVGIDRLHFMFVATSDEGNHIYLDNIELQVPLPLVSSFRPEKGIVGTTVTIMGENFSSTPEDNVVSFGGIETDVPSSVQY